MNNNKGYHSFNPDYIVSLTDCPHGVRNIISNEIVTREHSSILETLSTAYVIEQIIEIGSRNIHVDLDLILEDSKSKKSDYRPHHMREGGTLLINQKFIISKKMALLGVTDMAAGKNHDQVQSLSDGPTTVIETETKTYVVNDIIHYDPANKFLNIPLELVIASKPTKKAEFKAKN